LKKNNKGLSILELLAVVIVMGLITAIAIVGVSKMIENGEVAKVVGDCHSILAAAENYFAINDSESDVSLQDLIDDEYVTRITSDYDTTNTEITNASPDTLELWMDGGTAAVFTGATYETVDSEANKSAIGTALGH